MTCHMSKACRANMLFHHTDGQWYCAVHITWMREPEYFERPNPLENPPMIGDSYLVGLLANDGVHGRRAFKGGG